MGRVVSPAHLDFYERMGFNVIPLHPREKYPALGPGEFAAYFQRASTPAERWAWWHEYSEFNIGVVTGQTSHVVVVDCDDERTYETMLNAEPAFERALTCQTGKGFHIYLRPDIEPVKTYTFMLNGLKHHIKAEGGQVVAPPSIHPSGRIYEWRNAAEPLPYRMEDLRALLHDVGAEAAQPQAKDRPDTWAEELYSKRIREGQGRNEAAAQLGGLLREYIPEHRWGLADAILRDWNEKYCDPPMTEHELFTVSRSMTRYRSRRWQ